MSDSPALAPGPSPVGPKQVKTPNWFVRRCDRAWEAYCDQRNKVYATAAIGAPVLNYFILTTDTISSPSGKLLAFFTVNALGGYGFYKGFVNLGKEADLKLGKGLKTVLAIAGLTMNTVTTLGMYLLAANHATGGSIERVLIGVGSLFGIINVGGLPHMVREAFKPLAQIAAKPETAPEQNEA